MIKILYIVGGIAYFLYTVYKKNKQNQESQPVEESSPDSSESWGMDDLISEFQNKYEVETEPNYEVQNELEQEVSDWDTYKVQNEEVIEQEPVVNYSSEKADHHAFENDIEMQNDAAYLKEEDAVDIEYDLKQMIISNTILTRPEY